MVNCRVVRLSSPHACHWFQGQTVNGARTKPQQNHLIPRFADHIPRTMKASSSSQHCQWLMRPGIDWHIFLPKGDAELWCDAEAQQDPGGAAVLLLLRKVVLVFQFWILRVFSRPSLKPALEYLKPYFSRHVFFHPLPRIQGLA